MKKMIIFCLVAASFEMHGMGIFSHKDRPLSWDEQQEQKALKELAQQQIQAQKKLDQCLAKCASALGPDLQYSSPEQLMALRESCLKRCK